MILGSVENGVPKIELTIGNRTWRALVDTGFNGDLELPMELQPVIKAVFLFRMKSLLAAGQSIEEDCYAVVVPFDGRKVAAEVTFCAGGEITLGTGMLRDHVLTVDFPEKTVQLRRRND